MPLKRAWIRILKRVERELFREGGLMGEKGQRRGNHYPRRAVSEAWGGVALGRDSTWSTSKVCPGKRFL